MELNTSKCDNCPVHHASNLKRLGIDMNGFDYVIALAGNPNTGKSTIFNNLTGLRQHTGNWPGKTVTRAEGAFSYDEKKFKIVDLPGTYSLLSTSSDEETARDFILFGKPDVTLIVADSTKLERNLNLVLQILEITDRAILVLNLIDEAARHGIKINERLLSKELGIPVLPAAARQKEGMNDILSYVSDVASGKYICKPRRSVKIPSSIKNAVETIITQLEEEFPSLPNKRWVAFRLLEGDQSIIDAVKSGTLGQLTQTKITENELKNE